MAIIGFLFLFLMGLFGTFIYLFLCSQTLPQYNIGGETTKWYWKVVIMILGIFVFYCWKWLFEFSPFTLTVG